jgi:hypothetical protein
VSGVEALVRRWEAAEASSDDAATAELVTDDFLAVGPVGFVLDAAAWRGRRGRAELRHLLLCRAAFGVSLDPGVLRARTPVRNRAGPGIVGEGAVTSG